MQHDYKKVTQLIGWLLLVIVVCVSVDLIILSGGKNSTRQSLAATDTAASGANLEQSQAQLGELLSDLLLCGQWPVKSGGLSESRGNPFEPRRAPSRPLFSSGSSDLLAEQSGSSCLTVREVLNK